MSHHGRILCISPYFPPLVNAEATCSGKLVTELLRAGVDVTVFSVAYPRHHPAAYDESLLWRPLRSIDIAISAHGKASKLQSPLLAARYHVSSWARWIHEAIRVGTRLHRHDRFQILYSRSYPMMAHVAAFWLARHLRIPWIANINDPWDIDMMPHGSQRGEMRRFLSRMWMKRVFRMADLLTFPSQPLLEFHQELAPMAAQTAVVPHIGYAAPAAPAPAPAPDFVILHAGKLGPAEITRLGVTKSLLEGFQLFSKRVSGRSLTRVRLLFVGPRDPDTESRVASMGMASNISFTGPVSYEQSLAYIGRATVCLLVEGRFAHGIFLPSKLADYVASRKPVIALSPENGVVADLAQRYRGIMRVDLDHAENIAATFMTCFRAYMEQRLDELSPSPELTALFDRDTVRDEFLTLIDTIVGTKTSHTTGVHDKSPTPLNSLRPVISPPPGRAR